jgi:hypothetical protein
MSGRSTRRRARSLSELHCYDIGTHLVRLAFQGDGWAVSVDGLRHDGCYGTEAAAWAAGVAAAEALDRVPALSPPDRGSARSA